MTQSSPLDCPIFDVIIIGAGVVGSAIARYLSRYACSVAVVEKESDVGMAASCRNSGVIHAGINYPPGSLRARFCMEGRLLLLKWCEALGVPHSVCGKLVVASCDDEIPELVRLKQQGEANGVPNLAIVSGSEAITLQPGIRAVAALHVPTSGIVSPYALTIAMAEDAAVNGVRFFLNSEVIDINPQPGAYAAKTTTGTVRGRWIVNCGGIHAGTLARQLDPGAPQLYPCVGEYLVMDKQAGEDLGMLIYPAPRRDSAGLGVHITLTTEGNVLLGPSDEYVEDPETSSCTSVTMSRLLNEAKTMWPSIPTHLVIGAYAGIRAKQTPPEIGGFADYRIRQTPDHPRVVHLIGIESPGLTAAPAIARHIVDDIIQSEEGFDRKPEGTLKVRRWPQRFDELSEAEKERLVAEYPDHGDIVCRCEGVTKHEVLYALNNPLGVKTLAGIKFRCRVMMGRCSGGYCLPRIVNILQEEYGWQPEDFYLRGPASPSFVGRLLKEDSDRQND